MKHLSFICDWNRTKKETARKCLQRAEQWYTKLCTRTQNWGDIPEQFIDPILHTLMEYPVLLPSSGMIMDKSIITRHLMGNPTDPFNRAPLSPNMLVPQESLRQEILSWISSRSSAEGNRSDTIHL